MKSNKYTYQQTQKNLNNKQVKEEKAIRVRHLYTTKDMGSKASTSNQMATPKSKNKPRDQEDQDNVCKKFIMVDEQQGMDITPLQTQVINPPLNVPPEKPSAAGPVNKIPKFDEYGVDNSEDEVDGDNRSLKDPDDDDEISKLLIKTFSPHNDRGLEKEIQQISSKQGLSPRGLYHGSTLIWNVRGINTQGVLERLKMLKKVNCKVVEEDEQQVTCDITHNELHTQFTSTFDRLLHFAFEKTNSPWCSVGDFNVITSIEEKLRGVPYNMRKRLEFIDVIEACGLLDLGFSGQKFTWSNKRGINHKIWKRLDRAMISDSWLEKMPQTTITHLPSVGSDQCPLLMEMNTIFYDHIKYFKFLNCWANQPNFLGTVKACWERDLEGNSMEEFGDIFTKVKEYEDKINTTKGNLIQDCTEVNRSALHGFNAEYIRFLKLEDSILKQKTQLQWFKDGDSNTKYFHSLIKGRRRRLRIHKILRDDGEWIQDEENIANAVCDHFQQIFIGEEKLINEGLMEYIPRMLNQDQNNNLTNMLGLDELKEVVFSMNSNPAAGPNGMNDQFFRNAGILLNRICWLLSKISLVGI
ncbi:hypothetical protein H5410_029884 [Solanum commersonii]|uniref:Uncharacterized protein n=1 Tax=Solanum commersonii TaxID=4109 RepID=A0A9J5YE59_SOLCO|nr:hypothetical protein H5410_029884 [Solanum commersonii]